VKRSLSLYDRNETGQQGRRATPQRQSWVWELYSGESDTVWEVFAVESEKGGGVSGAGVGGEGGSLVVRGSTWSNYSNSPTRLMKLRSGKKKVMELGAYLRRGVFALIE